MVKPVVAGAVMVGSLISGAVMYTVGARDVRCPVAGSIVDDQCFYLIDPLDLARQVCQRFWQCVGLVEAGNLDDQLHGTEWPIVADAAARI